MSECGNCDLSCPCGEATDPQRGYCPCAPCPDNCGYCLCCCDCPDIDDPWLDDEDEEDDDV